MERLLNPVQLDGLSPNADVKQIGTNLTKLRIKPVPEVNMKKLAAYMDLHYWLKPKCPKKKVLILR